MFVAYDSMGVVVGAGDTPDEAMAEPEEYARASDLRDDCDDIGVAPADADLAAAVASDAHWVICCQIGHDGVAHWVRT